MDKARPFKHGLDPLIRKQAWEVDAAALEVAKLRQARDARERELEELLGKATALESELRALQTTPGTFDIDRYQAMAEYLRHQRQAIEAKREEAHNAITEHEQAVDRLRDVKKTQKALEERRETKRTEHASEERRRFYHLQEEVYLMRWRRDE